MSSACRASISASSSSTARPCRGISAGDSVMAADGRCRRRRSPGPWLVAEHGLEIAHVLLGLAQERAECLSDVGQPELRGLLGAISVALQLIRLELEIEL